MEELARLFDLSKECVRLCEQLKECFSRERKSLIGFQIDDLLQNNIEKESLFKEISGKRESLKLLVRKKARVLEEEQHQNEWQSHQRVWDTTWRATQILCEDNQRFIRRSLTTLGLAVDHLKGLFGEQTLYSKTGAPFRVHSNGRVVEASF